MYALVKTEKEVDDETVQIYAVEENGRIICDFTTDKAFALKIVHLLNENKVESNHVIDIIEDMVYSWTQRKARETVLFFYSELYFL